MLCSTVRDSGTLHVTCFVKVFTLLQLCKNGCPGGSLEICLKELSLVGASAGIKKKKKKKKKKQP